VIQHCYLSILRVEVLLQQSSKVFQGNLA